ncbi:hypothetical protein [Roseburia intestinalis]
MKWIQHDGTGRFLSGARAGNGSKADDERCNMIIGGLNTLIHFADQQYFSSMTDPLLIIFTLDFLASRGSGYQQRICDKRDTYELVNGKISEVGNDYVVPSSIQQKAVKRYKKVCHSFLNGGTCVDGVIKVIDHLDRYGE